VHNHVHNRENLRNPPQCTWMIGWLRLVELRVDAATATTRLDIQEVVGCDDEFVCSVCGQTS
jgi:hypothetical protein